MAQPPGEGWWKKIGVEVEAIAITRSKKKELLLIRSEVQRTFFRPFLCVCWRMGGEDDLRKWISEGSRVEKCYNEHNSAKHPPMQKY